MLRHELESLQKGIPTLLEASQRHLLVPQRVHHLCSLVEWSQLRDLRSFISGVEEAASLPVEQTHDRAHVCVGCGLVQIAAQKREKIASLV
jgi:hypothetical protein